MKVSVVAPVFDEQESLEIFVERVLGAISREQSEYDWELILVDDGSTDDSAQIIQRLAQDGSIVKGIVFTRNFGHQNALLAGIVHSSGDAIVTLDSDLQDPPELIPEMLRGFESGFDVVHAVRTRRLGEKWTKRILASVFYRTLRKLVDFEVAIDSGDFRLISRRVVSALERSSEGSQYLRGQISWFGYSSYTVSYERESRKHGFSKYPFRKSLRLALDAIVSLSGLPLRLVSIFGIALSCLVLLSGSLSFGAEMLLGVERDSIRATDGWIRTLALTYLLGATAVIAGYIGRLMFQVRKLPPYVISEMHNFDSFRR